MPKSSTKWKRKNVSQYRVIIIITNKLYLHDSRQLQKTTLFCKIKLNNYNYKTKKGNKKYSVWVLRWKGLSQTTEMT